MGSTIPAGEPSLAVIVPTIGRALEVRRLLPELLRQAPRDAEIVIVDQSDVEQREQTARFVTSLGDARVMLLGRDTPGLPAARNAGLAVTTGRIVLFLDDDVVLHPGCIAAHLARYRDPTIGGVVGRIVERRLRSNRWWTTNRVARSGRVLVNLEGPDAVDVEALKGANMSLRRAALAEVGPFDVAYRGTALLEDADLSARVHRAGWRLTYEPEAAVDHLHAPVGGVRVGSRLETERWRFHNTALFARRHPDLVSGLRLGLVFGAVALRRGVEWRDPRAPRALLAALVEGWMR